MSTQPARSQHKSTMWLCNRRGTTVEPTTVVTAIKGTVCGSSHIRDKARKSFTISITSKLVAQLFGNGVVPHTPPRRSTVRATVPRPTTRAERPRTTWEQTAEQPQWLHIPGRGVGSHFDCLPSSGGHCEILTGSTGASHGPKCCITLDGSHCPFVRVTSSSPRSSSVRHPLPAPPRPLSVPTLGHPGLGATPRRLSAAHSFALDPPSVPPSLLRQPLPQPRASSRLKRREPERKQWLTIR
eukprot:3922457-Rhodomonas_salina.1